jgi:hypothetical protein
VRARAVGGAGQEDGGEAALRPRGLARPRRRPPARPREESGCGDPGDESGGAGAAAADGLAGLVRRVGVRVPGPMVGV